MAKVTEAPQVCPKCDGTAFYDNRQTKKSPKQPDWKCKNVDCAEGFWLPDGGKGGRGAPAAKDPRIPQTWENMTRVYQRCAKIALSVWASADATAQVAATATLFIQANQAGLQVEKDSAAPVEGRSSPVNRGRASVERPS